MQTKFCRDCQRILSVSDFTKNKAMKDGLSFYCRTCSQLRHEASRRRRLGPPRNRVKPRDLVVPEDHKWCPNCDTVKSLDEFPRNKREPSGYMSYCRPCFAEATYKSRAKNHGSTRNYHLIRRYGITEDDFDEMFAAQGGVCAICREAKAEHVDHDHATGKVRGLLCFNCNGALGQFRDRTDLMIRAVGYLRGGAFQLLLDQPGVHVGFTAGMPPRNHPNDPDDLDALDRSA